MTEPEKKFRRRWINLTYWGPERRRAKRIIFMLLWTILFALFFYRFVISSCLIEGDSMHPSLKVGSYHLINRFIYFFREPQRGEIIVLLKKPVFPFYMIKRIIGLPGETVEIKFGHVYINGEKLEESYVLGRTETTDNRRVIRLQEHEYFVLGDNRTVADDSRYWGALHREEIVGKLIYRQNG